MTPLISVVMASYNHEQFISETIKSVLNQTFEDFELNIVDDGSSDNSREIINKYAELDPRIRTVFHEKNEGIARTYNDGLDMARGQYIALVASDDMWHKDKLKKQIEVLKRNENLVVWSEAVIMDAEGKISGRLFSESVKSEKRKKNGDIFEELVRGNYICAHIIAKRENIGLLRFDEELKYLNDYKFLLELSLKYKYLYLPDPLVMYRIHKGNTINSDASNWRMDMIQFGEEVLQKYGHKISRKSKKKVFLTIAAASLKLGYMSKSSERLYKIVRLIPLKWVFNSFFAQYLRNSLFSENNVGKIRTRKTDPFAKKT